ncbi:MAG: transporter substrate-binding domain-containing protein [Treponema sp.]|jgi:putative glutamine transport system substrate-binding protein|nr:transporter substrate-binding domain-containing protein [Treponema sp.]
MKLFILFQVAVAALFFSCDKPLSESVQVRAIQKRGVLRVGISTDMKKFSYLTPAASGPEGFEIDLAKLFAKEMLGNENAVQFVPVSPRIMFALLDNGEIDCLIAGVTITEERKKSYRFTSSYYEDAVGVMVRKNSGIGDMQDLNGKRVGVVAMTTARSAFEEEARRLGISIECVELGSHNELMAALRTGKIDAFGNDFSLLSSFVDSDTHILNHRFAPQPYGIAVNMANDKLTGYLEEIFARLLADGAISRLLAKWEL